MIKATKTYAEMTAGERKLQEACQRVCLPIHQQEIFNDFLNFEEQTIIEKGTMEDWKVSEQPVEQLSDFDLICRNGPNNIERLAEYRALPPRKVALDLALELDLLSASAHRRLTREFVGDDVVSAAVAIKYHDGQLHVNQVPVCSVRRTKRSKQDHILQSFDELAWKKASIDFAGSYDAKQIADVVLALNKKQDAIRFSVSAYTTIRWQMGDDAMQD